MNVIGNYALTKQEGMNNSLLTLMLFLLTKNEEVQVNYSVSMLVAVHY